MATSSGPRDGISWHLGAEMAILSGLGAIGSLGTLKLAQTDIPRTSTGRDPARKTPGGKAKGAGAYRRRLYKAFKMTGGPVERHYGLNIGRGDKHEVFVDCKDYILDKCKELNISEGSFKTPMAANLVLPKMDGPCLDSALHKT